MEEESIKQKIVLIIIDKLFIAIVLVLLGWYIEARTKRLDNELTIQRELFLGNLKIENDKTLKQIDQAFQLQQTRQQQDFELQLEKLKSNISYSNDLGKIRIENQRHAFARLMALKIPWTQFIRTHLEAKILSEFYERRYQLFSHDIRDLDEAKNQYDRALSLIKDVSNIQKEIFEVLGIIQANFKINPELQKSIEALYNYRALEIKSFPMNFNTQAELDAYNKTVSNEIEPLIKEEYTNKIESIISLLRAKVSH
jgi:hypothetical protein